MVRAVYPGSFDPVTFGHLDIIRRSSALVDELIVGVLNNNAKSPLFSVEERVRMLEEITENIPKVRILPFEGLLVEFVKAVDARMVIRGLREIETAFLTTSLEYSYLSSTTVKEVAAFGGDISQFVPEIVIEKIQEKMNKRRV